MESNAMKKIYFAFLCAACAFTLFSCQKENNGPEESPVPDGYVRMTLKAVSDETKTTVDGTTVKWAKDDQIKVYFSNGEAVDFTLVGDGGSASGEFDGTAPVGATALYAVYPTDLYASVSETTVNVTIPDDSQDGVFGKGNIAVAKVNGDKMSFKNVNAFVGFTVPAGATKVVVSSVGGQNLAGTLAVDCSGENPTAGALSSGSSSITVTFPVSTGGTYYVAVAPGVELTKGLLLTWYNGEDVTGTYWLNKAVTTASGSIINMETVSADGHYYVSVDGAGKKNGMNVDNAWSASQFWSKLHPGGTDAAMDNAKLANINGATFHLAAGSYNWGTGAAISINESETISFTIKGESGTIFTGDDDADGTGDHRILILDGNMSIVFEGITFTKGLTKGSSEARFGGGVLIKSGSHSFVDCTFTQNSAETSGKNKGYGGAIRFDSNGVLTLTRTAFSYNTATGDSGALSLSAGTTEITDCSFSNNSAPSGGAIDCFGSSELSIGDSNFSYNTASSSAGGAVAMEEDATCSITTTQFDHNSANTGGAISISGGGDLKIKRSYFYRNDAHTGGAVYTVKADEKYATVFVDECSFVNNWISGRFGCIFNMNGFAKFCMYNSSAKDSYTKSADPDYLKGLNPSWIAVDPDGGEGCVSFGNCSIIGDTWDGNNNAALSDGTALIAIWGTQTNYFTNCIIAPETAPGIAAIKGSGGTEKIDLYYTHYSSIGNTATPIDSGGNTTGCQASDFGSLTWSSNCWTWNGQINGVAPTMATQAGVYARINTICPDFVIWAGDDMYKDQRNETRADSEHWWPGAYQQN